jgi:hypothetical protein
MKPTRTLYIEKITKENQELRERLTSRPIEQEPINSDLNEAPSLFKIEKPHQYVIVAKLYFQ